MENNKVNDELLELDEEALQDFEEEISIEEYEKNKYWGTDPNDD